MVEGKATPAPPYHEEGRSTSAQFGFGADLLGLLSVAATNKSFERRLRDLFPDQVQILNILELDANQLMHADM